jgi:hypothetical protein
MAHLDRGWTGYVSDRFPTAVISLKCVQNTATQNGTSFQQVPPTNTFWPSHTSDLRHASGVDSTGKRDSMVAMSTTSPIYAIGASFADDEGNTYTVDRLKPENVRTRNLK